MLWWQLVIENSFFIKKYLYDLQKKPKYVKISMANEKCNLDEKNCRFQKLGG